MVDASELDTLRPALEALALCRSPELRERLLFEAVHGLELSQALALWKRLDPGGPLRPVLSRGPQDLLPSAAQVEAVVEERLPPDVLGGMLVLASGRSAHREKPSLAFAFGGLRGPEEALDLVEAILLVWSIVDAAGSAPSAFDTLPSPLRDGALASEGNRLAHDLRNLLQCIVGNEGLAREAPPGELEALAALIDRDVERAASLLRQALGQGSGRQATSNAERIEAVCASETSLSRAAGFELELVVEPAARHGRARWSDLALERVLRNLIQNARQALAAGGRGGTIRVRWSRGAQGFELAVRDEGPGLPDDLTPGFGLTSVQALSRSAGGRVAWRNLPTGGAEFTVTVPPP